MTEYSVADVRRLFRMQGYPLERRTAELVLASLPRAALATGWSKGEVLEVIAINAGNGAVKRLLIAGGLGYVFKR